MIGKLLLLLGHLVRADTSEGIELDKSLKIKDSTLGSRNKQEVNGSSLSTASESITSSSMTGLSSAFKISSMPVDRNLSMSSVAGISGGKDTSTTTVTQESAKKSSGGGRIKSVASVIKHTPTESNKDESPTKAGMFEEASMDLEFRGNEKENDRKDRNIDGSPNGSKMPVVINSMPVISDKFENKDEGMPYWTTIVVDDKLKKVKVNVKIMTVVESIDGVAGSIRSIGRAGDSKSWDGKPDTREGSRTSVTASMTNGKETNSRNTGGSLSRSVEMAEKSASTVSVSKYKSSRSEGTGNTISRGESRSMNVSASLSAISTGKEEFDGSRSAFTMTKTTSASTSSALAEKEESSKMISSVMPTSVKKDKSARESGPSKVLSHTALPSAGEKNASSDRYMSSSNGKVKTSINLSSIKASSIYPSVRETTRSAGTSASDAVNKYLSVTSTVSGSIGSSSKGFPVSSTSNGEVGKKSEGGSSVVSVSPGSSVSRGIMSSIRSRVGIKARDDSSNTDVDSNRAGSSKHSKHKEGSIARSVGNRDVNKSEENGSNPEINELFYVLKNMPGKTGNKKGRMFVEGDFIAPEEEKLKDKKFRFSGYVQATQNR